MSLMKFNKYMIGLTTLLVSCHLYAAGECNAELSTTCRANTPEQLIDCINTLNSDGGGIIDLRGKTHSFAVPYALSTNALPFITSTITIRNGGIERDLAASFFRLIFVSAGGNLSLCNVTLRNGHDTSANGGGAIFVDFGASMATIDQTTFANNVTTDDGGALNVRGIVGFIGNSTFNNNVAAFQTAAAGNGGAIYIELNAQVFTIFNSTFYQNNAKPAGGAIYLARSGGSYGVIGNINNPNDPGGIYNSTIFNNTVGNEQDNFGFGAGIQNCGVITVLQSNILAQNFIPNGQTDYDGCGSDGVLQNAPLNNVIGSNNANSFNPNDANNIVGTSSFPVNPHLGPFAYNGGPTQTLAVFTNSPAIGFGANPLGLSFDQRGTPFSRTTNGAVDSGAYQLQEEVGPVGPQGKRGKHGFSGGGGGGGGPGFLPLPAPALPASPAPIAPVDVIAPVNEVGVAETDKQEVLSPVSHDVSDHNSDVKNASSLSGGGCSQRGSMMQENLSLLCLLAILWLRIKRQNTIS